MALFGRSQLLALALAVGATGWILSGQLGSPEDGSGGLEATAEPPEQSASDLEPSSQNAEPSRIATVRVREYRKAEFRRDLVLNGRTEANRSVTLKAQVAGPITELPVDEGTAVTGETVLTVIAIEDRDAKLAEARALLAQRRIEQRAASKLQRKGFAAETRLAEATASLREAQANLTEAQLNLERTRIAAPFDGVLEHRAVEIGDYVQVGDPVATVIDLDPIIVVAPASEKDLSRIEQGQQGRLRLLGGYEAPGRVTFLSRSGDQETRTFRVELSVPNAALAISANQTAELVLPQRAVSAHRISPSLLSLNDAGTLGVKAVDDADIVRFMPIAVLAKATDGIWISGLPATTRLITVGQAFVRDGQKVRPVLEGTGPTQTGPHQDEDPAREPTAGSSSQAAGDAG